MEHAGWLRYCNQPSPLCRLSSACRHRSTSMSGYFHFPPHRMCRWQLSPAPTLALWPGKEQPKVNVVFSYLYGFNVPGSLPEPVIQMKLDMYIYKKKRGSLYWLLVPRIEAFALPILSKRATQKPTPICIYTLGASGRIHQGHRHITQASTVALPLTGLKVAKFLCVREQSVSKRLLSICHPIRAASPSRKVSA